MSARNEQDCGRVQNTQLSLGQDFTSYYVSGSCIVLTNNGITLICFSLGRYDILTDFNVFVKISFFVGVSVLRDL